MKFVISNLFSLGLLIATTVMYVSENNRSEKLSNPYYLAISVKNIKLSRDFYEKIGFEQIKDVGGIYKEWILMTNGSSKIGLYQDMFPKNTITFNPDDARLVHRFLVDQGIETTYESGVSNEEGPCFFTLIDPDGNPILIDQH